MIVIILLSFSVRGPQVLCYLTSWSGKRPGSGKFLPEDIDASLCTHVIYAFATLKDHRLAEADDKDVEMYERVVALRDKNPDLKVLLFIHLFILNNLETQPVYLQHLNLWFVD